MEGSIPIAIVRIRNDVALGVLLALHLLQDVLGQAAGESLQSLQLLIEPDLETGGVRVPQPPSPRLLAVSFLSPQAEPLLEVESFLWVLTDPNLSSSVQSTNHEPGRERRGQKIIAWI